MTLYYNKVTLNNCLKNNIIIFKDHCTLVWVKVKYTYINEDIYNVIHSISRLGVILVTRKHNFGFYIGNQPFRN